MAYKNFDVIVIGAGAAGYSASFKAVAAGLKVALIEKEKIGGICLNWGCVPSKSLQASAELFEKIQKAKDFGLKGVDFGKIKPDWTAMIARANSLALQSSKRTEEKLHRSGVEILKGEAIVIDSENISLNGDNLTCENLIIATGSRYTFPTFLKQMDSDFYTPKTILTLEELPKSMTIIGGGVIGIEYACLFATLGVDVNLVDEKKKIMPYMDNDLTQYLQEILHQKKIKVFSGYKATSYSARDKLVIQKEDEILMLKTDIYLSCIGRKGNFFGLENLLKAGLEIYSDHIRTDTSCRTNLPHVYAVGDINGRFMTAHVASKEGEAAVDAILEKEENLIYDFMPYNMYSNPEFASVGLTEKEALHRGFLVSTGKFSLSHNAKAQADGDAGGFIKIVFDKKTEEILGVHIATKHATDLIGEAIVAMNAGMTIKEFAKLTHPHPTLSEALVETAYKGIET